eukprot:4261244-Prymnesium_polylepis.1
MTRSRAPWDGRAVDLAMLRDRKGGIDAAGDAQSGGSTRSCLPRQTGHVSYDGARRGCGRWPMMSPGGGVGRYAAL